MTYYIEPERLNKALEELANSLDTTVPILKRAIYEDMQAEYDEADIRQWFEDQSYVYSDNDVCAVLNILRDNYDSNMSCWENIEAAYNNAGLFLPCEDDIPEERPEEEPSQCQVTFPLCQQCAYANECEAYQHALEVQKEVEAGSLPETFMHDTDNCESFEPVDDE